MAIDLGDVHSLTHIHVVDGVLATAGTMRLELTQPDGTLLTITPVTPVGAGSYRYEHLTTQAGRHVARWVGTGDNPGAAVDVFDVRPADPGYVVSLADVKAAVNIDGDGHDDELRSMIEAATEVVENVVGPVTVRSRSEVHPGGSLLVLHHVPALALTSLIPIHPTGTVYLPGDVDLDGETGIVRRLGGGGFTGPLRVVYTAGRRVVPPNVVEATKVIVAHLWATQRGHSGARPGFGEDPVSAPGAGFLVPHRATELLAPHRRGPVLV